MGGEGEIVEADETYIGQSKERRCAQKAGAAKEHGRHLGERGGSARSFHADGHSAATIAPIVRENIAAREPSHDR